MSIFEYLRLLLRLLTGRPLVSPPPDATDGPLRIPCTHADDVPPVAELATLSVPGRHVVLQFPPSFEAGKREVIEKLASLLPAHSVFDSGPGPGGTTCITVLKVLDRQTVIEHLPLWLAATRDFADTARRLCTRLAEAHGLPPAELFARRAEVRRTRLDGWRVAFHGSECCFTHGRTGQAVDVRIAFGDEFGVFDPFFLAQFVRTTPAHRVLAGLVTHDFHDLARVLDVMREEGLLRPVEHACGVWPGVVHRGYALTPEAAGP